MAFRKEIRDTREVMRAFVVDEPNSLLDMNKIFFESCTVFSNGGDYNEDELELEKVSLQAVDMYIKQTAAERAELVRQTVQVSSYVTVIHIYIYVYVYLCMSIYMYIYIYMYVTVMH
jgi:hypothetical protein